MNNLILLQFGSFLLTFLLGMSLLISRIHAKNVNVHYETSRWLLMTACLIMSLHYVLQIHFGFREQGDDVGGLVNILFYAPAVYMISYAIINLASGKKYKKRYLVVSIATYSLIVITFVVGLIVNKSLHMGFAKYLMAAIFACSVLFAIIDPIWERSRILKQIENNTASDLTDYNYFMRIGLSLLFLFTFMVPAIIFSRILLAIVGPLFLLTLFVYIINFICLGFSISPVAEVLDVANDEDKAPQAQPTDTLSPKQIEEISNALDIWKNKLGFADADCSLDKLARRLEISPRDLSTYISICHGSTFRIWLSKIRIEHAKKMLIENPDAKIEVVAEESGFTSRSYFQNLFKAETGFTPKEWRFKMCVS